MITWGRGQGVIQNWRKVSPPPSFPLPPPPPLILLLPLLLDIKPLEIL